MSACFYLSSSLFRFIPFSRQKRLMIGRVRHLARLRPFP